MYDLAADPDERHNLAADPGHATTRAELERDLAALLEAANRGGARDPMPIDEGIKTALPDAKIR
jgi:hypothetical protein